MARLLTSRVTFPGISQRQQRGSTGKKSLQDYHYGGDGDLKRSQAVDIRGAETMVLEDLMKRSRRILVHEARKIQRFFNEMGKTLIKQGLEQCFLLFPMLRPFNMVPHVVVTPI